MLGLSLRHVRRILAAYRKEGAAALAHGNRGSKPHNALDDGLKRRVLELAQSTYAGCNTQHFTELMAEREGIAVSRSAVRLILLWTALRSPRKRRPPKHRSRTLSQGRDAATDRWQPGDDWLEGRGPYLSLVGAIDDATGKVPHAFDLPPIVIPLLKSLPLLKQLQVPEAGNLANYEDVPDCTPSSTAQATPSLQSKYRIPHG